MKLLNILRDTKFKCQSKPALSKAYRAKVTNYPVEFTSFVCVRARVCVCVKDV